MSGDVYWDVDLNWDVSDALSVTFGGNNIFNASPDPEPDFLVCCGRTTDTARCSIGRDRITTFAVFSVGIDVSAAGEIIRHPVACKHQPSHRHANTRPGLSQ